MPTNDLEPNQAPTEATTTIEEVFASWNIQNDQINQGEANRLSSEIIDFLIQEPGRTSFVSNFNSSSDFKKAAKDLAETECDALDFLEYLQTEAGKNKFTTLVRAWLEDSEEQQSYPLLGYIGQLDNIEEHVNFCVFVASTAVGPWEMTIEENLDPETEIATSNVVLTPIQPMTGAHASEAPALPKNKM